MKILVPTDFSDRSKSAVSVAVAWAESRGAALVLLHVTASWHWPGAEARKLHPPLREASERRLKALRAELIGSRVETESVVLDGTPDVEIAGFAEEQAVDLVVIATHGHSALKRFLLGSTTERIVRSAPCSVLVVRDPPAGTPRVGNGQPRRILAATDFSDASVRALVEAVQLARRSAATIDLVHVLRETDRSARQMLMPFGFPGLASQMRRRSLEWLEKLQVDKVGDAAPCRALLRDGVPSAEIADAAAEGGTDLIVVGPRGRSPGDRFLLGSTAERVVRVAPCSVLVVKDRSAAAGAG